MRRTPEQLEALRAEAIRLRQAGVGGKRIAKRLGIGGALACELLRGVPLPGSLQRPMAKDELREAAVLLRSQGRTYDEIRDELGMSKGTLSLWLRDLPHPTKEQRSGVAAGGVTDADIPHDAGLARQLRVEGWLLREIAVALSVTPKTVCLWTRGLPAPARAMHGRTAEPWDRREKVVFINSDPGLIDVFVRWLRANGVPERDLQPGVSIHESADVAAAERYWAERVGIDTCRFSPPNLKRHNPKTKRKNTGTGYYGCLIIRVRQSRLLYQRIAGTWQGIVDATNGQTIPDRLGARHRTLNP